MKIMKRTALFISIVLLFSALSACSVFDGTDTPVDEITGNASSNANVDGGSAADGSAVVEGSTGSVQETASQEQSTSVFQEVTVTAEDKAANIDKFIGSWVDQSDSSRYAVIMKTEIGYSYTDNESTFPAEVKDGVLQINIEVDDAVATGEYDEATGVLTVKYQDTETKFKKSGQGG